MFSASIFSLVSKMGSGFENFSNQVANDAGWMMGMMLVGSSSSFWMVKSKRILSLSLTGRRSFTKGKI